MTRTALPYEVDDISALARSLAHQLSETPEPGHQSLLNMLARGAGFRNFQHFRASATAAERLAAPAASPPDMTRVAQVLRHFDESGRLMRWPSKTWMQHLAIWALWSRFPRDTGLTERQASALIGEWHGFGDAAILRRTMVERGLLSRVPGGNEYRRIETPPPPEARALIRHLHGAAQA